MAELHSDLSNDGCYVKTIIKPRTYSYTFNWIVENFSQFQPDTEKNSPTFQPLPCETFYAILRLNPNLTGFLSFYHLSGNPIEINHKFVIERHGQVILNCSKLFNYEGSSRYDQIFLIPIHLKAAGEEDVLNVKCVMEFCGEDETNIYFDKPCATLSVLDDLSALSKELKTIYDASLYTDVSLKVGDSIVPVHKLILRARSPVLARMFETPMGEMEKNIVDITDLELSVLKDMVSYLYSGVLANDDFESVYAMYYAADKYDVSSLRKKCATVLLSKLDVENGCRVLALADQHSDVDLKNSVMDFIKFHFSEVLETDSWRELADNMPRLAIELVILWSKKSSVTRSGMDQNEATKTIL